PDAVDPAAPAAPAAGTGGARAWAPWALFVLYRRSILFTYALFNVENVLRVVQPTVLGLAVDDLLAGSGRGLGLLLGPHLARLLIGSWRRAYDTRTFTRIYADVASRVVLEQRAAGVPVSRVAARSALSRELVDFLERDVAVVVFGLYSLAGSLFWLASRDGLL